MGKKINEPNDLIDRYKQEKVRINNQMWFHYLIYVVLTLIAIIGSLISAVYGDERQLKFLSDDN